MSAVLSPCGIYRYRLDRDCGMPSPDSKVFAYFGINPSTADAQINDATVRKWIGFTRCNGGHRFIAGNVFSFRSRDVNALAAESCRPIGPEHWTYIEQIIAEADVLVPCWGRISKVPKELRPAFDELLEVLQKSGKPVLHFGLTKCGCPLHPQMLAYATPLTPLPVR